MGRTRQITSLAAAVAILLLTLSVCLPALSQTHEQAGDESAVPTLVEVYWQSYKTVVVAGITNLIVLDQDIAQAETGYDTIKFIGVGRGETVALGYINGKPVSMRIRVVQRPIVFISPGTLQRQAEMAQGSFSSSVQTASTDGLRTLALVNGFSWSQLAGKDGRFSFMSQVEDDDYVAGHDFNLRTASAVYEDPRLQVRAIDFTASLVGDVPQTNFPISFTDFVALRGAAVSLTEGDNHYEVFAGTTIPYFFLSLGSTRDIAGFTYRRKMTRNLSLFATTSYINAPLDFLSLTTGRRNNYMQNAGLTWRLNSKWAVQGAGGVSNHGGMGRGEFTYNSRKMTVYGSAITSSVLFPMNQLGSLFTGSTSFQGGWTYRDTDWLTQTVTYQHVITQGVSGVTTNGDSDIISPVISAKIGTRQMASLGYTYSHSAGGFSPDSSTGNQVNGSYQYLFAPRLSNAVQFTVGSLQDPLQLNSEDQYMVRDTVSFPIFGGNNMYVAVERDQTNPSLVEKLQEELGLLTPALENLFLSDPVAFVNSNNLPPEIRALLNAENQLGTSISASAQFHVGNRLNFGPNFSLTHANNGSTETWNPYFGYGLTYAVTRTLQLTSGLSNVWYLANNQGQAQHTSVFSFGVTKSFTAMPASLLTPLHHSRVIEGRVFRDSNVKGFFSAGESGFGGLQVRLENGETATTDELGRYKFTGVSEGVHTVSLDLNQFGEPIRMTTKASMEVDLIRAHIAVVDFGVVNFARLLGVVFNDLRLEGKRQPDSKGMPEIHLTLDDGKAKRNIVSQGGEYEVDDLPPGDYTLQVDMSTVPPNYVVPQDSFKVHISPISSIIRDIPVRALRSISGRVFLKVMADSSQPTDPGKLKIGGVPQAGVRGGQAGGKLGQAGGQASHMGQQGSAGQGQGNGTDYNLVPMAGIQIRAGNSTSTTDQNGNFLLRDLPAGDLIVTVVPLKPMPPGMQVPSGAVHLPAEPIQVQGATIVISNPDLVPYLAGKSADEVRDAALHPAPKPEPPAVTTAPVPPAADSPGGSRGTDTATPAQPAAPAGDSQGGTGGTGNNRNLGSR